MKALTTINKPQHPEQTGRDVIIECLERQDVDTIFAYGGTDTLKVYQFLASSEKIKIVSPCREQSVTFAASGYARATGKPGVCVASSGSGAMNFITGLMDAKRDSIPIVALTAQVKSHLMGTDAFRETDIVGATFPCVKHSYLVKNFENIPAIIQEAFEIATTGRPGPVLIDFPKDILEQKFVPDYEKRIIRKGVRINLIPAKSQIRAALELIHQAKKPMICVGGGVISSKSSEQLKTFVKKSGIPVAVTLMGLGSFPASDELCLHLIGTHGAQAANLASQHTDLLIALGTRFDNRSMGGDATQFCPHAKIIQVDIDASEINKNKKVDVPIQGDVRLALEEFNKLIEKPSLDEWQAQIKKWKKSEQNKSESDPNLISSKTAMSLLANLSPPDTIVCCGSGNIQILIAQNYKFETPRTWLSSCGLGATSFCISASLGAKVTFPKKTVLAIDDIQGFLTGVQELKTLIAENLVVKCVIFNDQHIKPKSASQKIDIKLVEIAKAFGIAGDSIESPKDVTPAFKKMLDHNGSYVLEVKCHYE